MFYFNKEDENRKLTLEEKYEKIIAITTKERNEFFKTNAVRNHEEKVSEKMKKVNEVRQLRKSGHSKREICRLTGISRKTVDRYLDDNLNPVHASYGKKKEGILTPYMEEIDLYFQQGIVGTLIEKNIRGKGYAGSSSTLRHYIADCKKRRKQSIDTIKSNSLVVEILKHSDVFKLLYHPIDKVKAISKEQFERFNKNIQLLKKSMN